jgi:integrase
MSLGSSAAVTSALRLAIRADRTHHSPFDEVERLLGAMSRRNRRVAAMLACGAGLRVGEICRLRVDDIDAKFAQGQELEIP